MEEIQSTQMELKPLDGKEAANKPKGQSANTDVPKTDAKQKADPKPMPE